MLYDELVHAGKVGMTWSDDAKYRNRGRRRRRRSNKTGWVATRSRSWSKPSAAKPAHDRTNQGDKTNLKKPGRRQESRAALDREFKPRREAPNTWSKPSAKEDYKKPTKPGTMNRPKPSHPTKSKKSK